MAARRRGRRCTRASRSLPPGAGRCDSTKTTARQHRAGERSLRARERERERESGGETRALTPLGHAHVSLPAHRFAQCREKRRAQNRRGAVNAARWGGQAQAPAGGRPAGWAPTQAGELKATEGLAARGSGSVPVGHGPLSLFFPALARARRAVPRGWRRSFLWICSTMQTVYCTSSTQPRSRHDTRRHRGEGGGERASAAHTARSRAGGGRRRRRVAAACGRPGAGTLLERSARRGCARSAERPRRARRPAGEARARARPPPPPRGALLPPGAPRCTRRPGAPRTAHGSACRPRARRRDGGGPARGAWRDVGGRTVCRAQLARASALQRERGSRARHATALCG